MKSGLLNIPLPPTQEGAKSSDGVIMDYDKFIIQKINEFPVTFRLLQMLPLTNINSFCCIGLSLELMIESCRLIWMGLKALDT